MLYYKTISNLMHEINNNSCPSSISHCFTHSRQIHKYNTRHCVSNNFYIKYSRLNGVGTSFVRYGAKVWNNISTDVRELGRIKFNKIIKKSLLTILELEDDYVDEKLLVRQMAKQRK